jgi:hypothetical protein
MALFSPPGFANCSAQLIPYPSLSGAQFRSLEVSTAYTGFQIVPPGAYPNHGAVTVSGLRYCNATVSYTSLDSEKLTTVEVWLPIDEWNGRMQAVGGGGWTAGLSPLSKMGMSAAISQGYAAIGTNGGVHPDVREWAFESPGKIDMKRLKHYASTSLNDLSIIGKSIVNSYYGYPPKYSYFNGCSQGGRQGFMLAQEYPKAFDGIVASAAAVNWAPLAVCGFWSQMVQHEVGYAHPCELHTLTTAAINKCDPEDGVVDGIISDPDNCHFDPFPLINTTATCPGSGSRKISRSAAIVANTGWTGLKASKGRFKPLNEGTNHESALVTMGVTALGPVLDYFNFTLGLADSSCFADGTCIGRPLQQTEEWIKYFIKKDPNYDTSKMGQREFDDIFDTSIREYNSVMGTNSTDLSAFHAAGGKILSYHGLVSISSGSAIAGKAANDNRPTL